MTGKDAPSFGAYAPGPAQEWFRQIAHGLPANYWGRRFASLFLGPAGGRLKKPRDVTVFDSEKARLHPYDNICEKRLYATPQLWDAAERAALADLIGAHHRETAFYFVDVGANAGLYSLFARSVAKTVGKTFHAACIEPDPEMQKRLAFNIGASAAGADCRIFPYAAADRRGPLQFAPNEQSRGMSKLDAAGGLTVQGAPLAGIVQEETGFSRIDAMKIDIEGGEYPALDAFFGAAPRALYPGMIILETSHEAPGCSARDLCVNAGYEIRLQTKLNAVLVLDHQS